MRSNVDTKAANRGGQRNATIRKIRPKGRKAPNTSKRAGRELVIVAGTPWRGQAPEAAAKKAGPEPLNPQPIAPEAQRIGLLHAADADEQAWADAFAATREMAERKRAQVSTRKRIRMRQKLRHALNYTVAGALSITIGAGASVVAYDIKSGHVRAPEWLSALVDGKQDATARQTAAAPEPAQNAPVDEATGATPANVKAIAMAHLDVRDVDGNAGELIPLRISAVTPVNSEALALRVFGLPEDATLSSGQKLNDGSWLLRDGEENDVKLRLSAQASGELMLAVEAITLPDGEPATPAKEMRVRIGPGKNDTSATPAGDGMIQSAKLEGGPLPIMPQPMQEAGVDPLTPGLPQPVPPGAALIGDSTAGLIVRGDRLMKAGDLSGARSFYLRAYERGNGKAAAQVAQTYDPEVHERMNVRGLKPDAAKAVQWYVRAAEAGDSEAGKRAAALKAVN